MELFKQGKISVSISIYDNKILKFKVRDYGCSVKNRYFILYKVSIFILCDIKNQF